MQMRKYPWPDELARTVREALIESSMSRIVDKIVMIARSATKVVAKTTMPRSATLRAHDFATTLKGNGFAGGLLRCTPCEGHQPFAASYALHPIPQNQCAAMWDSISASLVMYRWF